MFTALDPLLCSTPRHAAPENPDGDTGSPGRSGFRCQPGGGTNGGDKEHPEETIPEARLELHGRRADEKGLDSPQFYIHFFPDESKHRGTCFILSQRTWQVFFHLRFRNRVSEESILQSPVTLFKSNASPGKTVMAENF